MKNLRRKSVWNDFLDYCEEKGISKNTIELISVITLIELTAKGLSLDEISSNLDIEKECLVEDLVKYTTFPGLEKTLDKSPLMCYNTDKDEEKFINEFNELGEPLARKLYKLIEAYYFIRKELDKYYDGTP